MQNCSCRRCRMITRACCTDGCSCWTESTRCPCRRPRSVLSTRRGQRGRPSWTERCVRARPRCVSHSSRASSGRRNNRLWCASVLSVCLRLRASLRVPPCSSRCVGPTTPRTTPPHPWPNLWPPATVRPTRSHDPAR